MQSKHQEIEVYSIGQELKSARFAYKMGQLSLRTGKKKPTRKVYYGLLMDIRRAKRIIKRERHSYLFAACCSAGAALLLFYKLFQNNLYLKILNYVWMAVVIALLILGNIIHGYFAFKSYSLIEDNSNIDTIKSIKIGFYKSLFINFFFPYALLIMLFLGMQELFVATVASVLLLMMTLGCYYLDLRPILRIKS